MTAQNAEIIRRGYDAFARADLPAVFEMLDQRDHLARAGIQPAVR